MIDLDCVAQKIYRAAFENQYGGKKPEPGWCWERAGVVQQLFAKKQARAATREVLVQLIVRLESEGEDAAQTGLWLKYIMENEL